MKKLTSQLVSKEMLMLKNRHQEKCHLLKEVASVLNAMTKHHMTWNAFQFCSHYVMFHPTNPLSPVTDKLPDPRDVPWGSHQAMAGVSMSVRNISLVLFSSEAFPMFTQPALVPEGFWVWGCKHLSYLLCRQLLPGTFILVACLLTIIILKCHTDTRELQINNFFLL